MLATAEPTAAVENKNDFKLKLPNFEGPLDVLLRLIEERQLEITAVSVAMVADQFLDYMSRLSTHDPITLSNFVWVAARLVLLKSRALLPHVSVTQEAHEVTDADDLVMQLRAYQLYKRAAKELHAREKDNWRSYTVSPPSVERPKSTTLPLDNVSLEALARAMQRVVDRWLPPASADEVISRLPFTVNDCIDRIQNAVGMQDRVRFSEILFGIDRRVEVIIMLLALLELLKRFSVRAYQEMRFGEIFIEREDPNVAPDQAQVIDLNDEQIVGDDLPTTMTAE